MRKKRDNKFNKLNIISIIVFLFLVGLIFLLIKLNILPGLYLVILIGILSIITVIGILFVNLKSKIFKIIGICVLVISILVDGIGIYYLYTTDNFFKHSFNKKIQYTSTFYVVTNCDNDYTKKDIKGEIHYYKQTNNIKRAIDLLRDSYEFDNKSYDDISSMFEDISNNKIDFMLVEKASYDIVFDLAKNFDKNKFRIIYEFDIKIEKENKRDFKNNFNIYLAGSDFAGLNDFNMIVSVNMKTHEVLLTSIPRDYYIEVVGSDGRKDTLSYMGPYGIDTSVKSLEKFFDINIDYYIKVNTNSLVGIVDQLGGITYCSDISYTTTHALVLNTYNDQGKKLYVKKGCQELNGIETLTVARERNAFAGRDRVRQENCRKIILSIFDKLKSTNTIVNYNQILNSLNDLYETTIPREIISEFAKDTINGVKWKIAEQAVDGSDSTDYVHLTNLKDWVMYPNEDSVNSAKNKIKEVIK